jgi:carbon-monoxide dehydrogenase small subunit
MSDPVALALSVNGESHEVAVPARKLLVDVLRDDLGLTGTHVGCEHGACGACTIWVDGAPARACLIFAAQMTGHALTTIEAIGGGALTTFQQAMHECHGLQCGFCTPGIVMTIEAWLKANPDPSEAEIRDVLSGHLCRCTGYHNIVKAVALAARRLRSGT